MAIKVHQVMSDPDIASVSRIMVTDGNDMEHVVMTITTSKNKTRIETEPVEVSNQPYREMGIERKADTYLIWDEPVVIWGKTHSSVVEENLLRLKDMGIDLFETSRSKMRTYILNERIARMEEEIRIAREREQTTRERLESMLDVNDGNFVKASVAKEVAEAKVEAAAIKGQKMGVKIGITLSQDPNLPMGVGNEYLASIVLRYNNGMREEKYPYFLCLIYKAYDDEEWSLRKFKRNPLPERCLFDTFSKFDESFMKGRIKIERDSRSTIHDSIRDALISKISWYPVSSAEDYNLYVDLDRCEQNYHMLAKEHDRYQEHLGILSHTIRTSTRIMEMDKRELEYIEKYVKYQQEEATHAAEDEG